MFLQFDLVNECKIVNVFLPISFNILGAQKNHLIERVHLVPTTHVLVEK